MKTKFFILLCICLFAGLCSVDAQNLSNGKITAKQAAFNLPEFSDTACKFKQEKTIKNSSSDTVTLKSGGNFKFIKSKGVIFETLYPVHSVSSYTNTRNKQVSAIINAVANRNYSYLDKNFDIFYVKKSSDWQLALKPKKESKIASQMKIINISGQKYINNMDIETVNTKTSILFTDCK